MTEEVRRQKKDGRAPRSRGRSRREERSEFDHEVIDLARVTRVTKGGKQLSFRACVVIGDRRGRVGFGVQKGRDVQGAVEKSIHQAQKNLIRVPFVRDTIPHRTEAKYKAGRVLLQPAPRGSGIIAGSSVRVLLELAGVPNVSAKILSKTNNKITNLKAAFSALSSFKRRVGRITFSEESIVEPIILAEVPKDGDSSDSASA